VSEFFFFFFFFFFSQFTRYLAVVEERLPGRRLVTERTEHGLPGLWRREPHARVGELVVKETREPRVEEILAVGRIVLAEDAHDRVDGRRNVQLADHPLQRQLHLLHPLPLRPPATAAGGRKRKEKCKGGRKKKKKRKRKEKKESER
jgi:hypothetical protein